MNESYLWDKLEAEGGDVLFYVNRVWTDVLVRNNDCLHAISKPLRAHPKGYQFSGKYQSGNWDGFKHYFDIIRMRFLSGFVERVTNALQRRGFKVIRVTEVDAFPAPIEFDDVELGFNDEYKMDRVRFESVQLPVIRKMLLKGRCSVRLATGGGKTEVMAGVAKVLHEKKVLILLHRIELFEQTIDRLKVRLGEEIGGIGYKYGEKIRLQRVTVGMVMTVWSSRQKIKQYLKDVDVVISDECHRSSSAIWSKVLMVMDGAAYRFGVSGTPEKGQKIRDLHLMGLTGPVIKGDSVKDLVDKGYAALPRVNFIDTSNVLGDFECDDMDFHDVYNEVYTTEGLWLLVCMTLRHHKSPGVVIFTERVPVCLGIMSYLRKHGISVDSTFGGSTPEHRISVLKRFKQKKLDVLVATTVLDEGIDVPSISGVVFLTTGRSIVRVMQRIGRGVRKDHVGKTHVEVYEYVIKAPYLQSQLFERQSIYAKEQFLQRILRLDKTTLEFVEV